MVDQAARGIHLYQYIYGGVFKGLVGAYQAAKLYSACEVADTTVSRWQRSCRCSLRQVSSAPSSLISRRAVSALGQNIIGSNLNAAEIHGAGALGLVDQHFAR